MLVWLGKPKLELGKMARFSIYLIALVPCLFELVLGTTGTVINGVLDPELDITFETYENWAEQINNTGPFEIIYPRSREQLVSVVNWAYFSGKNVRIQGYRHSQSPITVSDNDDPSKIVIIDMRRHMKGMKMGSKTIPNPVTRQSTKLTTVIAEPGASMEDLFRFTERNGFGLVMAPIVGGDATVGGVLAIGGHGAGLPSLKEKLTGPGYTFGSVSNAIVEIRAVVWDPIMQTYKVKKFTRTEPDIAAFIVHLGRALIVEVTLMVGPNYNMRCLSRVDVPASELFAHPANSSGARTVASFHDQYGRVDAIWFPFADSPWLKLWEVTDSNKPPSSELTTGPYNYQFSFTFDNPQTPGTVFGPQSMTRLIRGLNENKKWEIWGPSKDSILYYNRSSTPLVYSGWVVLTNRGNVQQVLHDMAQFYTALLEEYRARGIDPIDNYIKLRVTGLDDPRETGIPGAVIPDISPTSRMKSRPDFDSGVWMNTLTTTRRPYSDEFMRRFEQFAYTRFNGGDALARPEWSKNWGHSNIAPHDDPIFIHDTIPKVFGIEEWNHAVQVLDKYDPNFVFTDSFLRKLMVPYYGSGRLAPSVFPTSAGDGISVGNGWSHSLLLDQDHNLFAFA